MTLIPKVAIHPSPRIPQAILIAVLCGVSLFVIAAFQNGTAGEAIHRFLATYRSSPVSTAASRFGFLLRQSGELCFIVVVLAARLLERKSGSPDLVCVFLLFCVGIVSITPAIPAPRTPLDLSLTACEGACSLVAIDPPRSLLGRMLVFVGAIVSVGMRFAG